MKKKILALCLVVVLVATAITGVTLAYFTDSTNLVENTFTVGGIDITLDEAKVDPTTGKEVTPEQRVEKNEYKDIIPGQELDKDPTIHVTSESQDCYVAATVTVTGADLNKIWDATEGAFNFYNIITGGRTYSAEKRDLTDDEKAMFDEGVKAWAFDNVILTQVATNVEGKDTVVINYFIPEVKKANEDVVLFENINIPGDWSNAEINAIEGLKIEVVAYAAQAFEFDSCLEAMAATWADALHV